ncbi:MAG: tetratricopeptide repeat protein [Bacteroidota bacterium]|nr:tetratricopeptide repeat protein [Bacteroidota bacterium]MDP3145769.1 tetratricopeptide repeat protein [Bacteroidota bacterium]MDP3556822.1 tetratricopeptide repeat protein [Bacteroidota bacterium]
MNYKKFILFIFILIANSSYSASKDSLFKEAADPNMTDSTRFFIYYDLAWDYLYSNTDSAYMFSKKAFVLAKKSGSPTIQTKILNLMGSYFQVKGDYVKAIDYYQKSLNLGESKKIDEAVLVALGNIGAIYITIGQNNKALEYQLKSLAIAEKIDNTNKLASIYNNLSLLYNNFLDFNKSLEYGNKSLEIYTKMNDVNGICSAYGNIGNAYMGLNNTEEALKNFIKNHELAILAGNPYEETTSAMDIGEIYFKNKQISLATSYFLKAQKIGEEIEDNTSLRNVYKNLSAIYKSTNNLKKALEYNDKYVAVIEELTTSTSKDELHKKEIEFEFNKRAVRDSIRNAEGNLLKDEKIKASKTQIEKDRLLKIALTVGFILVFIFGIVIFNRFRIIKKQKEIIETKSKQTEEQKAIIENKNKEITDSINYAKRIQYTLLAHSDFLTTHLGTDKYFTLFHPKDIVSGDFYWACEHDNKFFLTVCDSTGHGVPGAFMSLLSIGFLSEAINEKLIFQPDKIFNYVRERLINSISKEEQKDGFDGVILCIDKITNKITYASANNSPIIIRDGEIIYLPKDKMPVGKGERTDPFTLNEINAQKGDTLYLYTDGYADQFGGPKGKKYKYKQLNEQLLANSTLPLSNQAETLFQNFANWKGELEQVDDVCLIGIRL